MAESVIRVDAMSDAERRAVEHAAGVAPKRASFAGALNRANVAVIAEIKRRSPSKGAIRDSLSAGAQALAFERGGAAAISVLTEPAHFGGALADLEIARDHVTIPLLRKDFHSDPIQLVEARAHGASAALLIARALAPAALERMMSAAEDLSLEPLVEARTEAELMLALDLGARVIGINSRDLETLVVDARVSEQLLALIPTGVIAVAESGIETLADVADRARWGADAVLVGSAFSASGDPEGAVRALAQVRRSPRAR
ncbi:MAG: indole-3-glycerol-phosphate synthase [Gemmatimonadota bacterium]